jgi:hypothetical protein
MTEQRQAKLTVKFVDDYCQWYESLFPEIRSFERKMLSAVPTHNF